MNRRDFLKAIAAAPLIARGSTVMLADGELNVVEEPIRGPYSGKGEHRQFTTMYAIGYKSNRACNYEGVKAALADLNLGLWNIPYGVLMMPYRVEDGWLVIDFVSPEPFYLGRGLRAVPHGMGEPICLGVLDQPDL